MSLDVESTKYLLQSATGTVTGYAVQANGGDVKTFLARISGSGAVSATVEIYGNETNSNSGGVLQNTFSLSGTDSDNASWATANSLPYWYAVISAISGTGASVDTTLNGN